ncbi:hypothetical protein BOCO_0348 [Bombiscardovia coagulans]|uniref:Uncharacterized protein n=1 Tax=Bombiscardovia coagulans TaxID=686666 RepID=A0A261ESJ9_9BIFI|nr:hypothetical protein BOCO_0348 [Bombiscardovia coagulans]
MTQSLVFFNDDDDKYILNRIVKEYGNATGRDLECKSHNEVPWLGVVDN